VFRALYKSWGLPIDEIRVNNKYSLGSCGFEILHHQPLRANLIDVGHRRTN
jgi:hypothetical protein